MEQGKIMEAEVPTVRVGAAGLTAPPPTTPLPKFFYRPDALAAAQPTASKHSRQHMGEGGDIKSGYDVCLSVCDSVRGKLSYLTLVSAERLKLETSDFVR